MSGIYLHIPFCRRKCAYCDFYSFAPKSESITDKYVDLLEIEWQMRKHEIAEPMTIYFGGGTPSLLSENAILKLAKWLPAMSTDGEFTVEFNPDDVTDARIKAWRDIGVNRISMGIQSLDNNELRSVGRRHTAEGAISAIETVSRYIDNISLDLIIGLPGQTDQSFEKSLSTILAYRPAHISVYLLSYEPGTPLTIAVNQGRLVATDADTLADRYDHTRQILRQAGYQHYEISNFSLPGMHSRHNSSYWNSTPYLGLGPSAHSFDGLIRRINPSDIHRYEAAITSGKTAYFIDDESEKDRINDIIITRLRTASGLSLDDLPEWARDHVKHNVERISKNAISLFDNNVVIPADHYLIADSIISELLLD